MSIPLGDLTIDEDLLKQALSTAPLSERARLIALIEELKRRQNREFAQQNFLAFVQQVWPSFIYGRHHARMAQEFEKVVSGENKRLIINLGPRHAVQIDEPIPTPTGWKTMQTLQVGDDVFGQDGKPTKVIGKSEVFHNQQLYRVTTDDGHSLDVDGEHLWAVRMKRGTGVFRDYTTEQLWLRQQGVRVKASRGGGVHILPGKITGDVRLPMLPQMEGSIYPEKQLLIDPYVLGLWLGDGASAQSHITSHDDDAVFVRKQFEDRGYVTTDQKTKYLFGILGLKVALRELGVLNNKHIPEDYLTASLEQRRDLLKGLMDSDGNVSKKGQCFFAQKSLGFITQVRELLCSLGIKNSMSSTEAKIGDVSYGIHHRLSFYATNICNLPRKEDRTLKTERTFGRYIKVEKLNATGDTQCIKVENEDGLFLAGKGYLCTHNTKSEFGSYLLPAWYLGKNPDKKIIQCSHTAELAVGFGRKVRNLVGSAAYQEIFPGVELQQDSKAAGRWNTSAGGSYFAIGVSGAVTGIGGDIIIIDDPHSEQEAAIAASNPEIYDKVYEWYTSGPRQRLQPGGSVIVIQTRWSKRDLTGQVKQKELEGGGDKWKVVELPAILPNGKPLWPEFWSIEELEATRNAIDVSKWQAQYQQNPTSEEGAIVKRDWWQRWEQDTPPPTSFILQAWDTAFEKHNRADYSACTTWGIFNLPDEKGIDRANIILLDAKRDRLEFPQLKEKVLGEYRYWEPDSLIIEKKASGAPLIYELRHMGIVVSDFTPTRGNDKISRLNAISDIFSSGRVWAPNTRWADEVIDEVAAFPAGQHDDYCFVAGTKILMSDGSEKNIEDVRVGDEVWSHFGAQKVLEAGNTGVCKTETLTLGGKTLEGTGGHFIYCKNGWKKLTELNRGDTIVTVSTNKEKLCQQNLQDQTDSLLNLTEQPTKNIVTDLIGKKSEEKSFYTEMFGNIIMEKSLKGIISTILMGIKTTMILPIYNLCLQKSTEKSIGKKKSSEEKLKSNLSTLKKSDLCQHTGMVQKRVELGMLNMLKKYLEIPTGLKVIVRSFQLKKLALSVEKNSYLKIQQDKNIAQTNVQVKLCMIKSVLKNYQQVLRTVLTVVKDYTPSIVYKNFAMEYVEVLSVEKNENLKKVYNLSVENAYTYFANGILVHNCDCVSMSLALFRKGGYISTKLDREDEEYEYRRKTSNSYY